MFYCVDKNFNCHSHAFCHAMYSYLYLYDAGFEVVRSIAKKSMYHIDLLYKKHDFN